AAMFLTPWATPGGIRTSREAPSPMGSRRTTFSVGDPARTSTRTTSILSLGGMNQTSVCRRWRGKALLKPGAETYQLGQAPAIVGKPLELDDLHTLDAGLGGVVLNREGALGLIVQPHRTRPPARINPSISLPIIAVLTALGQEGPALYLDPTGNGGNMKRSIPERVSKGGVSA